MLALDMHGRCVERGSRVIKDMKAGELIVQYKNYLHC